MDIPKFKDRFLTECVLLLMKRSKSLNYKSQSVNIGRVIEDDNFEKLEIVIRPISPVNSMLSLNIWQDKWVWLDIRKKENNKWKWVFTIDGVLQEEKCDRVISCIERTIVLMDNVENSNLTNRNKLFEEIWRIAPNPKRSDSIEKDR